jgi:hypothetical protein
MSLRKMLLSLGGAVAVAGVVAVAAEPPVSPLVEGREPNPVVRDYHDADPPTFGYGAGPVAAAQADTLPGPAWLGVGTALGAVDRFTMPLGVAVKWE